MLPSPPQFQRTLIHVRAAQPPAWLLILLLSMAIAVVLRLAIALAVP